LKRCEKILTDSNIYNLRFILLGVLIPILISFILLSPIITDKGIPAYGDTNYLGVNKASYYFSPLRMLYSWSDGKGPEIHISDFSYIFLYLSYFLDKEIVIKAYLILCGSLAGILTFFAMIILLREWGFTYPVSKEAVYISIFASLFYMLVFVNSSLLSGASSPGWIYSTIPLAFALSVRYLRRGRVTDLLLLFIVSMIGFTQPNWLLNLSIIFVIYTLFETLIGTASYNYRTIIKRASLVLIIVLLSKFYVFTSSVVGYLLGGSGIFSTYTSEKTISFPSLAFLSKWSILDIFMLGERQYFYFWLHPQNYTPFNILIPVLATISLFMYRKNSYVIFILIIFAIGVFLSKGVNDPAGYLYYVLAKELPYALGAALRNPGKFISLVTFSYSFLIGISILKLYRTIVKRKKMKPYKAKLLITLLACVVLSLIMHGTLQDLQAYTWIRFKPVYVPETYNNLNNYLVEQKSQGSFKVMWIPSGGAYVWKPYIITAFPDILSSKPAVYFGKVYPEPLRSVRDIGELLKALGVRYVIYHGDSISYPNEEILRYLLNQEDLKIAYKLNYTYVPKDNSKAPLPAREAGIVFNGSLFKLVSPEYIPRGKEVDIVIRYAIPDYVVEKGFKGAFHAGFNIGLRVVEAGASYRDGKVYETSAYKQVMVSETEGYAYFRVKVPYNYPGTAVDIYADFYDGSFKPLTPVYFVGRLPVKPRAIDIPFVVFENTRYEGPIYTAKLAVVYGLDKADVLRVSSILNDYAPIFINADIDAGTLSLLKVADAFIYSASKLPKQLEEYLSGSSIKIIYVYPISKLSLPTEKPVKGPVDRDSYVYNETPLTPLGDFVLERGKSKILTFRYRLPQPVVEKGFKGRFWAGFGMIILGYPHGIAPPLNQKNMYRVFEVPIYNYTLINDYEGLVSFNVTVPSNFHGSAVDVYVWFYDGDFKRISPIYYVGTFNVKGVTLLKSQQGIPVIHIVNDSLTIPIYLPKDGEYILYLRAKGLLRVKANNTDILVGQNTDSFDSYYVKLHLNRGLNRITLSTNDEAFIESIAVYESSLNDSSSSGTHQVLSYRKVNPTYWEVVINASKPFVLVFTEPYDRLWRAYINGKELKPIPIFGLVNGFVVNETGIIHIRIYYTLQTYYLIGIAASAGTFTALLVISLSSSIDILRRKVLKTVNRKT
jgi:hypothetical protein